MVRNVAWTRWFHASLSATLRSIVPAPRGRERDLAHAPVADRHGGATTLRDTEPRRHRLRFSPPAVESHHDEWRPRRSSKPRDRQGPAGHRPARDSSVLLISLTLAAVVGLALLAYFYFGATPAPKT